MRLPTFARVRACYFLLLFFVFFSLDCPFSPSHLSFFPPETTLTVCVFFLPKTDLSLRLQSITTLSPITPPRVKRIARKRPKRRRCTSRARNRAVRRVPFVLFTLRESERVFPRRVEAASLRFGGKGDFFENSRGCTLFFSFRKRARKTFSCFFLSLSLSVSLSLCVCSPRDEIN